MTDKNLEQELNESEKWLVVGLEVIKNNEAFAKQEEKAKILNMYRDVDQCIYVEKGETLIISAGSVWRFAERTGIIVKGGLLQILGSKNNPVFLQAQESTWEGIVIDDSKLENKIDNTKITEVKSVDCGAITLFESKLSINYSNIHECESDIGGGIYTENSEISIDQCNINGNFARTFSGGGMYNYKSKVYIRQSKITDNTSGYGGGIANYNCPDIRIMSSIISQNTADKWDGGGIFNYQSKIVLIDAKITKNSAIYGGGIANFYNSETRMKNTLISDNIASKDGGGIFNVDSLFFFDGKNTICRNTPNDKYELINQMNKR